MCFLQDILAGCKEALTLSPQSGVILERLSSSPLQKSNLLGSGSGKSSPGLSEEILASSSSTGSNHDDRTKHSTLLGARPVKGESEQASHDQFVFFFKEAYQREQLPASYYFLWPSFNLFLTVFHHINVLQALSDEAKDEFPEADVVDLSSPSSGPTISLLSPKAMEMAGRIIKFEQEQREKAKVRHKDC